MIIGSQQLFSIAYLKIYQKNFFSSGANANIAGRDKLREIVSEIDEAKINECLSAITVRGTNGSFATTASPEIKKDGKLGIALSGGGFRASLFHIGVLAALAEKDELRKIEIISMKIKILLKTY